VTGVQTCALPICSVFYIINVISEKKYDNIHSK
jgi:hypothetical protein